MEHVNPLVFHQLQKTREIRKQQRMQFTFHPEIHPDMTNTRGFQFSDEITAGRCDNNAVPGSHKPAGQRQKV
jgi:hypothetical protein